MTFNIKTAFLLLLLPVLMGLISCKKDFIHIPPEGEQSADTTKFWQTQGDATLAVNAMYANLRSWTFAAFAPMAVESLGSDDASTGTEPSDGSFAFMDVFDKYTVTSTSDRIYDFWSGMYGEINYCNQVLDNIPGINMDATLKARYLLEAKFLRAYSYFRLVRAFGDVPLRLHVPKDASEYNIPRAAKADIWAAIEQDLTDAAGLPPSYSGADVGRITKGAALALHAKVAMYQGKWADVKNYTEQVTGLGYSLFPNYHQLFRVANENCSESIFEIQCELITGNAAASNSQYSQIQGVRGIPDLGWGYNTPTQNLVDEFEPGDPRLASTVIPRGTTTAEGDIIAPTDPNPMYNYKSYVPFSTIVSGFNQGAQQNIRVIRYADVLLMNAEANNELGNTSDALASLNAVRARARGGNNAVLPNITITDQSALRNAIWHERRVELAMEFDSRYFDVIRQGRAAEVFGPLGWHANKNEVWPIPDKEILNSGGMLTQNPGYN